MIDRLELIECNIKRLRLRKRLTRQKLAEKIGMSTESVKAYETMRAFPSLKVAYKLAVILECPIEELYKVGIRK